MRIFGRLLRYVLRHKARLLLAFALALLGVAVELARPWPIKVVVDYVLTGRPLPPWLATLSGWLPGAASRSGLLGWSVALATGQVVAGAALNWLSLMVVVTLAQRLVYDLSRDLFAKLQRLSLAYHGRHSVGDLMQRMGGDVFVVHFAVAQVAIPATVSLLSLIGMFVIMARLDLLLALVALAVTPLLAASLALFSRPMSQATAQQYQRQGALMALVEQSLSAIKAIQGFTREAYVQRKIDLRAAELGAAFNASARVSAGYKEITGLLTGVAAALLLGLGAQRVLAGALSLGDLLIFLGYLAALYGPVNALSTAVGAAIAVAARGRRVFEIIDAPEELAERPDALALGRARGEITLEDVTFGYDAPGADGATSRPILRNISLRARPGQITAIVGATGAGKSSLVALLSRFYDPWRGRVLIDGHDARDLTLQSLRANGALVLQDAFLFPMSVADNIGFGRPDATRDEIIAAAQTAHAHEFIERLPQGYETIIGERGSTLSGGERQRIAIARALLTDAPILILDEPTSALDAHTEAQIFDALSQLMHNKTTFIISHRLTTIRRADQILALEHGRIVERGTHESLLAED